MTVYRWNAELSRFEDKRTGEPMQVKDRNAICKPYVQSDIPEYRSPIDGKLIGSRSTRREDLKKNDCVPWEPLSDRPRGIGNPRFAAKHGLKLDEAAVHRKRKQRIDPLASLKT